MRATESGGELVDVGPGGELFAHSSLDGASWEPVVGAGPVLAVCVAR